MNEPSPENPQNPVWPLTDWSGVRKAAESVGKDADRLEWLIRKYQGPLRGHLVSTFEGLRDQADELLHDFARDKILREGWLAKANREQGRFRNFLKASLTNFVRDRLEKAARAPASLDAMETELP